MKKLIYDPLAQFEKIVLSNGLKVFVNHIPERNYEYVSFTFKAGAKDDRPDLDGQAHFVEHLVSKNIPGCSYEKAKEFFNLTGGHGYFGGTYYAGTRYYFKVSIDQIDASLDLFKKMLIGSKFENFVERERDVILNEYYREFPSRYASASAKDSAKFLFRDDPRLSRFICPLGHDDVIKKITQAELQSFYDDFYTVDNLSIVAVGGLTVDEILKALGNNGWNIDAPSSEPTILSADLVSKIEGHRIGRQNTKGSELFSASAGFVLDDFKLSAAIPGGLTNREAMMQFKQLLHIELDDQLRQKNGKVYGVSESYWDNLRYYDFSIRTKLPPGNLELAEKIIFDSLNNILTQEDKFELNKVKFLKSIGMRDSSVEDIMNDAHSCLLYKDKLETAQEEYDKRQNVTFDDIKNVVSLLNQCPIFISTIDSTK